MKKLIYSEEHPEGILVEMTAEEIALLAEDDVIMPSIEDRIEALESAVVEIAEVVANG